MLVEDTKFIYLNSRHGISRNIIPSYKSDITFPFKGLLVESNDIIYNHIEVVNAQIPVSFYNINYTNSQLNYFTTNPNIISTINIPYGNYSITTLIQQLTLSFAASSIIMNISYSKTSGRLTFTSSINFSINTFDDTYTAGSSLYQIMGFRENTIL